MTKFRKSRNRETPSLVRLYSVSRKTPLLSSVMSYHICSRKPLSACSVFSMKTSLANQKNMNGTLAKNQRSSDSGVIRRNISSTVCFWEVCQNTDRSIRCCNLKQFYSKIPRFPLHSLCKPFERNDLNAQEVVIFSECWRHPKYSNTHRNHAIDGNRQTNRNSGLSLAQRHMGVEVAVCPVHKCL